MITRTDKADGMPQGKRSRLAAALGGASVTPLIAGLTFIPREVLSAVAPGCATLADCLLATADALALDFAFVPGAAGWSQDVLRADERPAVWWVVDGPLWRALGAMSSVSEGLAMTARDPAALTPALDLEASRSAETLRVGRSLWADGIVIAEDLAGREGPLFTPAFLSDHILPRLAALVKTAGRLPVILHSDGDLGPLLPLVAKAGFAGVHAGGGVDRDRFEKLFWTARRLGLAVVGGIPTGALDRGTHAAVRAGTHAALLGQTGGLLVADDGGISTVDEMNAFAAALGAARAGRTALKPAGEG